MICLNCFFYIHKIPVLLSCFCTFYITYNIIPANKYFYFLKFCNLFTNQISKTIQYCRMTFHYIIKIRIHPTVDIFRHKNSFCPFFIFPGKTSIPRFFLYCTGKYKRASLQSIFFKNRIRRITVQMHTIKVLTDCFFNRTFTFNIKFP